MTGKADDWRRLNTLTLFYFRPIEVSVSSASEVSEHAVLRYMYRDETTYFSRCRNKIELGICLSILSYGPRFHIE